MATILIRFITNDEPRQAKRAGALIEGNDVFVAANVLLESEWVLRAASSGPGGGFGTLEHKPVRRAKKMLAAQRGQSVSALVRELLSQVAVPGPNVKRDLDQIFELLDRSATRYSARRRMSRDKVHAR
jgi:hypothetical protein